jgi:hypothetical protein
MDEKEINNFSILTVNYLNSYFKLAVFFLFPILSFSQKHQLTGKTQDSLQNPVPKINIIATPLSIEDVNITYVISRLEGEYKLKLENNTPY